MRRYVGTLYLTQLVFGLLVFFTLDWPWVSGLLPAAYLVPVGLVFHDLSQQGKGRVPGVRTRSPRATAAMVVLLWQLPGLLGSLANLGAELGWMMRIDILDFVMQTWHMPLLPWLAAAPNLLWRDAVLHYWLMTLISPALILLVPWTAPRCRTSFYHIDRSPSFPLGS